MILPEKDSSLVDRVIHSGCKVLQLHLNGHLQAVRAFLKRIRKSLNLFVPVFKSRNKVLELHSSVCDPKVLNALWI